MNPARWLLVLCVVVGMWARDAAACGEWSMESVVAGAPAIPRKPVRFHWENISLPGARMLLAPLQRDDEGRTRTVTFPKGSAPVTIDGGVLRLGEQEIGRLAETTLVLRDRTYVIDVADVPAPVPPPSHKRWMVTVKLNDVVILSGRAMSLWSSCGAGKLEPQHPRAAEEGDIRNRVALYLAIAPR